MLRKRSLPFGVANGSAGAIEVRHTVRVRWGVGQYGEGTPEGRVRRGGCFGEGALRLAQEGGVCRWGCTVWDMLVCGMAMRDGVGLSEEIGHEGGLCRFGGRGDMA